MTFEGQRFRVLLYTACRKEALLPAMMHVQNYEVDVE